MVIGLMLGMFLGGFEMTVLHVNEGVLVLARSDERPSDQRKARDVEPPVDLLGDAPLDFGASPVARNVRKIDDRQLELCQALGGPSGVA